MNPVQGEGRTSPQPAAPPERQSNMPFRTEEGHIEQEREREDKRRTEKEREREEAPLTLRVARPHTVGYARGM